MSDSQIYCTGYAALTPPTPSGPLDHITDDFSLPTDVTAHPISNFVSYRSLSPSHRAYLTAISSVRIPSSTTEALRHPSWKAAMMTVMDRLQKNNTLKIVSLPLGRTPLDCKWVFTVKYKEDGSVNRYIARLVAKGYTQRPTIDFGATFAPFAKLSVFRLFISLAVRHNWPLHHLDVKNAYIQGDLSEEIYMTPPPGFELQGKNSRMVYRLFKSINGLKQAEKGWFRRFREVIVSMGFSICYSNHTIFRRLSKGGTRTIVLVYMDDVIITGDDTVFIAELKTDLAQSFDVDDLGPLKCLFGIEVARSKRGILLCQRKYILDLLSDMGMLNCSPCETPMDPNHLLPPDVGEFLPDPSIYRSLVGRLVFLTNTRPDIALAVNVVCRFVHSPRTSHLDAVHRILRYLKSCPGLGLFYAVESTSDLSCYTEADYAGSSSDKRAPFGYCTLYGNHLITWKSKKQNIVSHSLVEAEYKAMMEGTCEIMWLRNILTELGFTPQTSSSVHCEKKAAAMISSDSVVSEKFLHVQITIDFLRDNVHDTRIISIVPVRSTEGQLANIFTRSLGSAALKSNIVKLGLFDIFAPA